MDDRIKEHLKRLNKYYLRLSDTRKLGKEIFIQEDLYQASSERYLQIAIESCLNIGNRLISLYQFREPGVMLEEGLKNTIEYFRNFVEGVRV